MEIITTKRTGNRIVHVIPDENNMPQIACWYFNSDNMDLLFGLLEAEELQVDTLDQGDRKYMICRRKNDTQTGAIAIKFTREGESTATQSIK